MNCFARMEEKLARSAGQMALISINNPNGIFRENMDEMETKQERVTGGF